MKQYVIWLILLMKRLPKSPSFVVLLLLIPVLAIGMSKLEQGEESAVYVGVTMAVNDGLEEKSQDSTAKTREWHDTLWTLLQEQDGILEFRVYDDATEMKQAVETETLDCGFVLPENLVERIMENDWRESVILYESATSTMTEFAKERIASEVFVLYAKESYVNYIGQTENFEEAEANGIEKEEIVAFAEEAYQSHLLDGSTFAFEYQGEVNQNTSTLEEQETKERFPVRGILAVCIFLSGMCGLLFDWNDRQEKRFNRICPEWMTTMVNAWIPTIYTSFVSLLTLGLLGKLDHIGKEIVSLLAFQFLIILYCSIIRLILRTQEMIAIAIPILTLASIICCPVFIRLALYLPVFRVVEKVFPVTYYLLM